MSRLIDADALRETIYNEASRNAEAYTEQIVTPYQISFEYDDIEEYIDNAPTVDAVHIQNDGTLEVIVSNAQKVGRVLVMDTDSHIGGGLFYPDDADRPHGEWYQIKDHKIMGEGYLWHCSICDYKVYQDSSADYPSENFCPNCGARMKGGAE